MKRAFSVSWASHVSQKDLRETESKSRTSSFCFHDPDAALTGGCSWSLLTHGRLLLQLNSQVAMFLVKDGFSCAATARLVRGAVATRVTCTQPEGEEHQLQARSVWIRGVAQPVLPVEVSSVALAAQHRLGAAATLRTRSVFLQALSSLVLPWLQVIARISTLGSARAIMMAWASSTPVSTSRISFFLILS
ncbi:hypothetical protein EYF80_037178 [Liparis tanakae]|uniref:Uncharacterized protein n=1 Tax=Liparis tanakae TaxID=230148 RepID=A0A4Z2GH25_9TELE|nr:hypothetical protein EYF80_037178 [Liparis tanakae]